MSLALYRQSSLGNSLQEVLNELQKEKNLSDEMVKKSMEIFDKCICEELSKIQKSKASIKARVTSFRNCDDIWIFYGKEVTVKPEKGTEIYSDKLKIITCDKNMKEQLNQEKKKIF
jgi:transcription initiation factor TFIIA small subunit